MPETTAENDVKTLARVIRPWTLCDDGGGFDHGSEQAARAVLAAGWTRVMPTVENDAAPTCNHPECCRYHRCGHPECCGYDIERWGARVIHTGKDTDV